MTKIKSMEDLLAHDLQDLRSAEEQLIEALPKMAAAATAAPLKKAFNEHLKLTKTHLARLDKALEILGKGPGTMKCKGMEGLIKEGDEAIKDVTDPATRDAALIGAAQRVEHYEIAGYGTARAHACLLYTSCRSRSSTTCPPHVRRCIPSIPIRPIQPGCASRGRATR